MMMIIEMKTTVTSKQTNIIIIIRCNMEGFSLFFSRFFSVKNRQKKSVKQIADRQKAKKKHYSFVLFFWVCNNNNNNNPMIIIIIIFVVVVGQTTTTDNDWWFDRFFWLMIIGFGSFVRSLSFCFYLKKKSIDFVNIFVFFLQIFLFASGFSPVVVVVVHSFTCAVVFFSRFFLFAFWFFAYRL